LIYTVGKPDVWNWYIAKAHSPIRAAGSSVWPTREAAEAFLLRNRALRFVVYGVEADWGVDTAPATDHVGNEIVGWRVLTRAAPLVALEA
jgi:hypothetical protein